MTQTAYILRTTQGVTYELAENGAVLARSNGPQGWNYSGRWIILGAATRHNAHRVTSLADIADHGVPGQGWVHDLDHGTHRMWGNERMASLTRV